MTRENVRDILCQHFPFELTEGQLTLMDRLATFIYGFRQPSFFILRGYAGTGKTTVISALVRALPTMRIRPILLAPTGRAAKVMSNYAGIPAYTIHKAIYFHTVDAQGFYCCKLAPNRCRNTLFIVDEASMLSEQTDSASASAHSLLDDLFEFVAQGFQCRLLLVGDTAQLPPVGCDESPALDPEFMEASFGQDVHTFELKEVLRQSADSGILFNATKLRTFLALGSFARPWFELEGYADIRRLNGDELEDALLSAYSHSDRGSVVVVTRSNKRANMFNQEIRYRVFGQESELSGGDLLMVVKNNYSALSSNSKSGFIANGDMVEVQRVQRIEEQHGFRFADVSLRLIDDPDEPAFETKILLNTLSSESPTLAPEDHKRLFASIEADYADIPLKAERRKAIRKDPYYQALMVKFAYALTAHKTQGGQWQCVFVDPGYVTEEMLNQDYVRWLYTAITRATDRVFLLNFRDDFFG